MFPKISLIAVIAGVVLIVNTRRPLTAGTSMCSSRPCVSR